MRCADMTNSVEIASIENRSMRFGMRQTDQIAALYPLGQAPGPDGASRACQRIDP